MNNKNEDNLGEKVHNPIDISDEDLEGRIYETSAELNSLENPGTITSDMTSDSKLIEDMYKKISNMPRDKVMKLLANFGRNHEELGESHRFTEMTQSHQKNAKQRLQSVSRTLEWIN